MILLASAFKFDLLKLDRSTVFYLDRFQTETMEEQHQNTCYVGADRES